MASLAEIQSKLQAAQPTKPASNPMQPTPVRGDELLANAHRLTDLDSDEKRFVKLFVQSKQIVESKLEEDQTYGEALMQRLSGLKGEALANKLIDEADSLKIDYLKQQNPKLFSHSGAATAAFLDEATFGQMSRILGKAGELINGQPYEDLVEAKAEEARLLQKAFPKSDFVGRAASFLIPGSPAKALFTKAATLGGKTAGVVLRRFVENPQLLSKVVKSAAAAGGGSAAVGATKGFLGQDNQEISFDRGIEKGFESGAMGVLIGGAIPVAAAGVNKAAAAVAPDIRAAARAVRLRTEGAVEQLTGTSAKALRASNTRGAQLRKAFGTEDAVGRDIVDFLQSSKSQLPEVAKANELLPLMPKVDARPVVNYLRGVKPGLDPSLDSKIGILQEWANRIEGSLGGRATSVPASKMREVVDLMQDSVREQFGKESPFLAAHLKQAARIARQSIVDVAQKQGGEAGQLYVQLMEKASQKRHLLKFIGKQLGSTLEIQEQRAEKFVSNLFGQNREVVRTRMGELDQLFGTNFLQRAENAFLAKQVGKGGRPSLFSNLPTGKAGLGTVTGFATGGAPGALLGAVASSPRAGAAILGASDKITGFVRRMVANPRALARLKTSGATPLEVRRIAKEIETALIKDGPISAGGVTRIVADTPYFIGLVHAFEKAEREERERTAESALDKTRNQEIAALPRY